MSNTSTSTDPSQYARLWAEVEAASATVETAKQSLRDAENVQADAQRAVDGWLKTVRARVERV